MDEDFLSQDGGITGIDIKTNVFLIDTATIKLSTFRFDSVNVSNVNRFLIGAYNDPEFDLTKSESYIQLNYSDIELEDKAIFDSIAVFLKYDGYFYNDTIPDQEFNVFEVLDDIEPAEDATGFYNTTIIKSDKDPIGVKIFKPRPQHTDSLIITLNKSYGQNLFNKIKDNDINDNADFLDEYKGLLLNANESNTCLLGYNSTSELRIYYSVDNGVEFEKEEKTIHFPINSVNSFNHIESNQQGTFFETMENSKTMLPSDLTDNNSFVQSGTGISTRIDIPYLNTLNDIHGEGIILDASLKISVKQSSNSKNLKTRDSLELHIINQKSEMVGQLYGYANEISLGTIEDKNSEYQIVDYRFPIMSFIDLKFSVINPENLFLAIIPQEFNSSVDRYTFYDESIKNSQKLKLEIIYAVYGED